MNSNASKCCRIFHIYLEIFFNMNVLFILFKYNYKMRKVHRIMKKKSERNGKEKYQHEKNSVRVSLFLKILLKIDKNNFDKNL